MILRGITGWNIGSIALLTSLLIVSFPDFVSSRGSGGPGETMSASDCYKLREYIKWAESALTAGGETRGMEERRRILKQLKLAKDRLRASCREGASKPPPTPAPRKTCQQLKAELMPLFQKDKRTAIRLVDYLQTNISKDMAVRVRNRLKALRQKWINKAGSVGRCSGLNRYLWTIPEPPPR